MNIYYFTFMTSEELSKYNLFVSPASDSKSNYIVKKLDNIIPKYEVITMAETLNKYGTFKSISFPIYKNGKIKTITTYGRNNRIIKKIQYLLRPLQVYFLLRKLGQDDIVIYYHSLWMDRIFLKAKMRRKFTLILELEVMYQDINRCTRKQIKYENEIIHIADGYILATSELSKLVDNKKYVICNGDYTFKKNYTENKCIDKIHCVYAGTFDSAKGGALAAVESARYLDSRYHIHILGFGSDKDKKILLERIACVQKVTECIITYDGLKKGDEYIRFLQSCQIGLCTQNPNDKYVTTSFPSKILTYLGNGLLVVSGKIPTVIDSEVGELVNYYDVQTPESIANSIMKVNTDRINNVNDKLKLLDEKFENDFFKLLKGIKR